MNRIILLLFCFLIAVPVFATSVFVEGYIDEYGGAKIVQTLASGDSSFFIPSKYVDLENDWDRWYADIDNIETNGEIAKEKGGYRIESSDSPLIISYTLNPMEARGDMDEFYLFIPSVDSVSYRLEFPKYIDGDVYTLTPEKSMAEISGNIVEGAVDTVGGDFALRALFDSGYFIGQAKVKDYSALVISLLSICAICIIVPVCIIKFKTKEIGLGEVKANSSIPDFSPFLASVYSGSSVSTIDVLISYLLYWQSLDVLEIETNREGFALKLLKPLPDSSPDCEKQLLRLVFGSSLCVSEKDIEKKAKLIKDFLTGIIDRSTKDLSFGDTELRKKKIALFCITGLFSVVAGILGSIFHFGFLTLVTLFCSFSLFIISTILAKSYQNEKSNLYLLGKIRFSAFPLVCYLFLAGYYGYGFSVFSSTSLGFLAAIVVALVIFFGTFILFGINKLDDSKKAIFLRAIGYKAYLESKKDFSSDELPYAYGFGINVSSQMVTILRKCFSKMGLYGMKIPSGAGFFSVRY